ncbi:MAG TPA: hypothetical protein VJQ57_03335 [Acidimicrobiia bacterium]|nr:hypothetical protein [Acidimicrobiia bacterium]
MATTGRAIAGGAGIGALIGGATGLAMAAFLLRDAAGIEVLAALIIYGTIGAMLGVVAGAVIGAVLGLLVGFAVNLLLGPASVVPRRPEQLPLARLVGSTIGLLPLLALPRLEEWWPVAVMVSLLAMVAIAKRVPKIVGITSLRPQNP